MFKRVFCTSKSSTCCPTACYWTSWSIIGCPILVAYYWTSWFISFVRMSIYVMDLKFHTQLLCTLILGLKVHNWRLHSLGLHLLLRADSGLPEDTGALRPWSGEALHQHDRLLPDWDRDALQIKCNSQLCVQSDRVAKCGPTEFNT